MKKKENCKKQRSQSTTQEKPSEEDKLLAGVKGIELVDITKGYV